MQRVARCGNSLAERPSNLLGRTIVKCARTTSKESDWSPAVVRKAIDDARQRLWGYRGCRCLTESELMSITMNDDISKSWKLVYLATEHAGRV